MAASGPPEERDPLRYSFELLRGFGAALRKLLAFAPIFLYLFVYWNIKERTRAILHYGALSFLSLSLILVVIEVFLELAGKDALLALIQQYPDFEPWLASLFLLSVVVILAHHQKERQHAQTEYSLAEAIWLFLETRGSRNEQELIIFSLSLVREAFVRFKVSRACLWQLLGNELVIVDGCIDPAPTDDTYVKKLATGEGVAGLVAQDLRVRYVPRVYAPFNAYRLRRLSWPFPHALKFDVARTASGHLDVVRPDTSIRAVVVPEGGVLFKSFVAVPLKAVESDHCTGVLCIDFDRTDPLGRVDIKMASVLGVMIAEELQRVRRAPRANPPSPPEPGSPTLSPAGEA